MSTPAGSAGGGSKADWLVHTIALVVVAIGFLVIEPWRADRSPIPPVALSTGATLELPLRGYLYTYSAHPCLASGLARTLADGSSIVLFGSSELTSADHPSKPMNFFNNELHVPLAAIGHAGNQSFSIYAQLVAANADLTRSRITILVSPGWFVGKPGRRGTDLEAFLEYQPAPSLYRMRERFLSDDPDVARVASYLADHRLDLGAAGPIVRWNVRAASRWGAAVNPLAQWWDGFVVEATEEQMICTPKTVEHPMPPRVQLGSDEWGERFAQGKAEHLAQCTNNPFFVNDAFYAEYVAGETRTVEALPFNEDRELTDLVLLLDYLKAHNAHPFFVLQPLNPFVYTNTKDLDPTMDRIREELDARDFALLDLWSSDTADFEPGILTDVMHLGPVGWYHIDSTLAAYFP